MNERSSSVGRVARARPEHRDQILALLGGAELPIVDLPRDMDAFWVWQDGYVVGGCCGLEVTTDEVGLLRSLAVSPLLRGRGLGRRLVERVVEDARASNLRELFLLTTSAAPYFSRLGFQIIARDAVADAVRRTSEFTTTCPSSAVVMCRAL